MRNVAVCVHLAEQLRINGVTLAPRGASTAAASWWSSSRAARCIALPRLRSHRLRVLLSFLLGFCRAVLVKRLLLLVGPAIGELALLQVSLQGFVFLVLLLEIEIGSRILGLGNLRKILVRDIPRGALDNRIERRGQDHPLCFRIGRPLDEIGGLLAIDWRAVHRQRLHHLDFAESSIGQHFLALKLYFDVLLLHQEGGNVDLLKLIVLLGEIDLGKDSFPGLVELRHLLAGKSRGSASAGCCAGRLGLGCFAVEDVVVGSSIVVGIVGIGVVGIVVVVGNNLEHRREILRRTHQRSAGLNDDISRCDHAGHRQDNKFPTTTIFLLSSYWSQRIRRRAVHNERIWRRRLTIHGIDECFREVRNIKQSLGNCLNRQLPRQRLRIRITDILVDASGAQFLAAQIDFRPIYAIGPANPQQPKASQSQGNPLNMFFKEFCDFHMPPQSRCISSDFVFTYRFSATPVGVC